MGVGKNRVKCKEQHQVKKLSYNMQTSKMFFIFSNEKRNKKEFQRFEKQQNLNLTNNHNCHDIRSVFIVNINP